MHVSHGKYCMCVCVCVCACVLSYIVSRSSKEHSWAAHVLGTAESPLSLQVCSSSRFANVSHVDKTLSAVCMRACMCKCCDKHICKNDKEKNKKPLETLKSWENKKNKRSASVSVKQLSVYCLYFLFCNLTMLHFPFVLSSTANVAQYH